ncbi:MAG: DEAD/DEAH box helicase family protein [Catonella sp.]|nr:DEAD/DEAH box helicase family protein [Catonella sp.]
MPVPKIKSFARVTPMIYAYNTPGIAYHDGWTKIGYTEKQTVEDRINQQTHTANIKWELAWMDNAIYKDGSGELFKDYDFHNYLERDEKIKREPNTEWFNIDGERSEILFNRFASRRTSHTEKGSDYTLRAEQAEAVKVTKEYFEKGGSDFLWNAKPRFGKTLTAYDLICTMGYKKVLIVTNRPSIANSWADDFTKFIGWRDELAFVSDNDALKDHEGVISHDEYIKENKAADNPKGMVAFESLQGLKGSVYFGGKYPKLSWISKKYTDEYGNDAIGITFDLLIIDESQEGVDTFKTERAFLNIARKHTLYLSGTPFKQLASAEFAKDQIYNWSYADEQEAKETWRSDDHNPYDELPKLSMFTYQVSNMIADKLRHGIDLSENADRSDYAFDLNEFFATNENGKFTHEEEVKKFLKTLTTGEKYPFSTPELRNELKHTLWYLNRVASAKALAKLLKGDPVFSEYDIVLAAGDGKLDDENEFSDSLMRVREAIKNNDKTITLTVGQLTVGITVPEWSGVLMLCNLKSPSAYMQAAFRAQNPCIFKGEDGKSYRKKNAYVFDFDPARTLTIFDEFANNLSLSTAGGNGTVDERKENIKRLLNFFPVIGEDDQGKMVELDAASVLSIPRKLKSEEVVNHGFISNFLFQNISNVFGAQGAVKDIIEKLTVAREEKNRNTADAIENISDVNVDENGDAIIPNERVIGTAKDLFGDKIYADAKEELISDIINITENTSGKELTENVDKLIKKVKENFNNTFIEPVVDSYNLKKGQTSKLQKQINDSIDKEFNNIKADFTDQAKIAEAELTRSRAEAEGDSEKIRVAEESYYQKMQDAMHLFNDAVKETVNKTIDEKPKEVIEQVETYKAEEEKRDVEDSVRAHLSGFSRTIPSFIMAYGDENLTLANFDDYTDDDVFLEVTGITEAEFRFLRDGGDYKDEESGEVKHFPGHLFDEVVFNDSISRFLQKKSELANYFDENQTEDIFDYIPPQKTNQIFTPKRIVKEMVDDLLSENPGCFDDPDKTFIDLYMKSGLYITEIVKRLYNSEAIRAKFPDDKERLRHIFTRQVYGLAPTEIIYKIAMAYIFGFDKDAGIKTDNFKQCDALEYAKNGNLQEKLTELFS